MPEVTFLSIILVWIHLIAATFWVGGILFLSLVAVPLLKKAPDPVTAQRAFINLALRFRRFVWVALALLVVTGTILLPGQVNLVTPLGEWPPAVLTKLSLVLLLVVVSLAHDQFIGPKVRILKHKPTSELTMVETILIRFSPLIGRLTMLLGLGVLLAAVFMVRT